jgi:hypothetical protein
MIGRGTRGLAALACLILVLAPSMAAAHSEKEQREKDCDHRSSSAHAAQATLPDEHHVYFRPFCRRARYVTNKSAPCWE